MPSTKRVGSFRVFHVDNNTVRDAAGESRRDVFTIAFPDWCNVIALTPENEVVLVWQYRFGTDALSLEIPGGVVDPGETPLHAGRRELLEETGYAPAEDASLELLLTLEPNPAMQGNRCYTYVARGVRVVAATSFDENEELEVALVPAEHIAQILDEGLVTHALVQSALERFLRTQR